MGMIIQLLFALIYVVLVIAVAGYGKNTALGYWGSAIVALVTSPLVAFLIIYIFLKNKKVF